MSVKAESFLLSKFTVTQDLYQEVMNRSPSTFKGGRRPVETVSWKEVIFFCNALSSLWRLEHCYQFGAEIKFHQEETGFRLPTEAEWQYACQAGTKKIRYDELDAIAWYQGNSGNGTREVGQKLPNPWGLYDRLGNVWEWSSDIYEESVYGSYSVFRGGGWSDKSAASWQQRDDEVIPYRSELRTWVLGLAKIMLDNSPNHKFKTL